MSDIFETTDLVIKGDARFAENPGGGGVGHVYDVEMNATNDEMTLTEDGTAKTTLPLVTEYVGTRAAWEQLSVAQKIKYRKATFPNGEGNVFSHVGQIIESTTLDTEAKVKAIYGSNTSWIQHTGYVLRGADSGVVADQAQNDGGADSVTVSSVANHNHTQDAHSHRSVTDQYARAMSTTVSGASGLAAQGSYAYWRNTTLYNTYTESKTATNIANGSTYNVATLPKYKNIYIWERVS